MNLESRIQKLEARMKAVEDDAAPLVYVRRLIDSTGTVTKCWLIEVPQPCDMAGFAAAMGAKPEYRSREGCDLADECESSHRCRAGTYPQAEAL